MIKFLPLGTTTTSSIIMCFSKSIFILANSAVHNENLLLERFISFLFCSLVLQMRLSGYSPASTESHLRESVNILVIRYILLHLCLPLLITVQRMPVTPSTYVPSSLFPKLNLNSTLSLLRYG